ncbi:hypothetical protein [Vibrio sagamiensis]|uniref:AraC family transcriptional regulator n=1 Tax=Vibrio sagamiensis NBRC 104589 TaxID=1219064 RepID=A0A511QES8_9VIBR|nr:hypothetical protein [Vibrio sagamiensis]PNQ56768.1 AraC family transcriptional regulator [Vibrio agarivorans]GEM75808.1 AraC family transcriptional regulator [Vibrio sagamiensis NBRC 104589]
MNYAIEFNSKSFSFLNVSTRKKALKHSFISVSRGLAIVKLGKHEYAIEPGQYFWIPQGCLSSITYVPNTQIQCCDFSVRLQEKFAQQAGFVKPSTLLVALIEKMASVKSRSQQQIDLLTVVKHEVLTLKPMLNSSVLTDSINQWYPNSESQIAIDLCLILTLREARKMKLSGKKQEVIIETLFNGNIEEYEQLCLLVCGEIL